MRHLLSSVGIVALAACGFNPATGDGGNSPLDVIAGWSGSPAMNPGIDCISCHSPTGVASYRPWTIAGTVYNSPDADAGAGAPNVQILVTDANGRQLTLVSNAAGNFYTAETLLFPLQSVMVQNQTHRMQMDLNNNFIPSTSIQGDCNSCHTKPFPAFSAPGRLFVPPSP